MAADPDLMARFQQAYDYFNQQNFTPGNWAQTMDPLLDDNVRMKKLDDPGYHEGRAAVRDYFLNGHGNDDQASIRFTTMDCQVVGDDGFISGFANFVDLNGKKHPPSPSRVIVYSFAYSKKSGSWKAVHLWGAYISPEYTLYKRQNS